MRMLEVFSARGATRHQINSLAEWIRENVARVESGQLDVIRFVELDLQAFFPGIYLEIKNDNEMGRVRAYVSPDPLGIVVAESIYNQACDGGLDAAETILHEVGHLFLHSKYVTKGLNDGRGYYSPQFKNMNAANSVEWQAKYFAICVLFPYSRVKNYTKRLELQVYFDLTVSQADRVLEHTRKLRLSESERSQKNERLWLESVISSLAETRRLPPVNPNNEQLEFFYKLPSRTGAFCHSPSSD